MNSKDRIRCVFSGERPDRYPCFEHFWIETEESWREQGIPTGVCLEDYFDFDIRGLGSVLDLTARLPEQMLEENERYMILKDSRGVTAKHFKGASGHTPHWIAQPINNPSEWWSYRDLLKFDKDRIDLSAIAKSTVLNEKDKYSCILLGGPYEQAWQVFGQVQMFMAMLEEPNVVKDALKTWTELIIEGLNGCIAAGIEFDALFMYCDMAYRNGPLFSPEIYRQLVMPAHTMLTDFLHSKGKKVILHSCGQIKSFIPMLIEVGFDALQPLEAKCDQDVIELSQKYGRQIVFFGNMDVRILSSDRESIKREVESKLATFEGNWNYIFHSDHSIPPTVSLDCYQFALETARGYLEEAVSCS